MKNMVFEFSNDLVLGVYRDEPTDAEWNEYLESARKILARHPPVLTITTGAGPNTLQRQRLNQVYKGSPIKVAVVTDDMAIRGIITAISWWNRNIQVFKNVDLDEALRYTAISPMRWSAVKLKIQTFRRELGLRGSL